MEVNGASTKTCGNCRFSQIVPQELGKIVCFGVPPTPVVLGAGRDQLGRVAAQIELIRPNLPAAERACALHQQKIHIELGSLDLSAARAARAD